MSNYDIGISGLSAAQGALDVISNNIANSATEGYHRQVVELSPAYVSESGSMLLGGGVDIKGVSRLVDPLLEQELLNQSSQLEHCSQEYDTLSTVENAFNEFSNQGGLNTTIDNFFNSLKDLALNPTTDINRTKTVNSADSMAIQFRSLGKSLDTLENQITLDADNTVNNANALIENIANLNANIQRIGISGQSPGNLMDQRDQAITDLSKLVGLQTQSRDYGVVDVSIGGIPVVSGATAVKLQAGYNQDGKLGLTSEGSFNYNSTITGGKLGGLISLKNDLVAGIHKDINDLAAQLIKEVNQIHVQGVGSDGSFTSLLGTQMKSENLSDFQPPITDGKFYIRVTNTATGGVTRHEINVNTSTDTLSSIAASISAITGMSASVTGSKLSIQAQTGYKFDFSPAVLPQPDTSSLTSSSPPQISVTGIYTGSVNQTYTCDVVGTGTIGNGGLKLNVTDGDGNVTELNIGSGYVPGSNLALGNGINIHLSAEGVLNDGDNFQVQTFANTDTSGFLAAAGINTFFTGNNAGNIAVSSEISQSPGRIAVSLGQVGGDGENAAKLADLSNKQIADLNNSTVSEYYQQLVANVGQDVSMKQSRQTSLNALIQGLKTQQSNISGVDVNTEAAQMIIYQQMFQAMAKYMTTVQNSVNSLMSIIT